MTTESSPRKAQRKRVRLERNLYQRTADGEFEAIWMGSDGVQHQKTLKGARNLTEARRMRDRIIVQRDSHEDVAPSRKTFAEVADEYLTLLKSLVGTGERAERTPEVNRQRYQTHLHDPLGRIRIQSLQPKHLSEVLASMRQKGLSQNTMTGVLTVAGAILNHAVARGYRSDNPKARLSKMELPKARNATQARVLDVDEIRALLEHATPSYKPELATAVFTGLRCQELLALRWGDVGFDAGMIRVRHQLTRATRSKPARLVPLKTAGSSRDIEIPPVLVKLLAAHKLSSSFSSDDDYCFATETGAPKYYRNVSARGLDRAADRASLNGQGRQKLSLHDLRHTAITHLIRQGADVGQVARFAGHAKPSMTLDKYTHEFEARKGNELATLMGSALEGAL
jgi:integrase